MVKIYLVRHAEAMGNVKEFFQGRTDAVISPKGEKQLDRLAERFRDIPIEAVYSSPLVRAYSTAQAVNRYHGFDIIRDDELMEINGGDWEGVYWAELPKRFPEELRIWNECIEKFQAPNGESTLDVYNRLSAAIDVIAAANRGRTIAVVSHGMAIKAYLTYAEGRAWENYVDSGWSDNTAVSLVEYDDNLKPSVIFKNDASHLTDGLSTLAVSDWCKK